jgi:hypothetical protein
MRPDESQSPSTGRRPKAGTWARRRRLLRHKQQNCKKSGFGLAYANVHYGGSVAALYAPRASIIA